MQKTHPLRLEVGIIYFLLTDRDTKTDMERFPGGDNRIERASSPPPVERFPSRPGRSKIYSGPRGTDCCPTLPIGIALSKTIFARDTNPSNVPDSSLGRRNTVGNEGGILSHTGGKA